MNFGDNNHSDISALQPLKNDVPHGSGTAHNIAELSSVQQELMGSEKQFANLFNNMREGFCIHKIICDEQGRPYDILHLLANPAYGRHIGKRVEDVVGHTVRELYPDADPIWIERYGKVALTGEPERFEGRFGPLGRWFDVSAYQPEYGYFALVFSDITERKEREDRLRQQAMVFNSTQEGIVITDTQGCVLDANPAFERITEYPLDEICGRNMRFVQSGRHDRSFYLNMWKAINETGGWQGEIWNRRKGGEIYLEWVNINAVKDDKGAVVAYVGIATDINRMQHVQSELERLAHHDALTNLPNRLMLLSRLEHAVERARRYAGMGAVLFVDLDRFKQVNDTLGHKAGDELLVAVARRMRERLRDIDTLARLGGDEFVIVLEEIADAEVAATVARELIVQLQTPFPLSGGNVVQIGGSAGIALFPQHSGEVSRLIEYADTALYKAKSDGRGTCRFYEPQQG
jgi:diguanylate cyclase (GGDEF)-like protein/PAS domain S-box-containing protein